jgi:CheY-like chemotaxis protein
MAHLLAGSRSSSWRTTTTTARSWRTHLTAESATVVAVSTAAEALPLVPSADIIVTDYALPGKDAVWLLEQVNKRPRPVPVIAISGFDESQQPRLAAAPFAGKLLKPLDFDQVCAEIAVVLGHRR